MGSSPVTKSEIEVMSVFVSGEFLVSKRRRGLVSKPAKGFLIEVRGASERAAKRSKSLVWRSYPKKNNLCVQREDKTSSHFARASRSVCCPKSLIARLSPLA